MPSLSELMITSGASEKTLWFLTKYGLEFDDEDFDLDEGHRKALIDLRYKRLSAYVIAYGWRVQSLGIEDNWARYSNLFAIASARGISLNDAFREVQSRKIFSETLATAQYWIDRAVTKERQVDALERIALWCKEVLKAAPAQEHPYSYLAVRLLLSLPQEEMHRYPKLVQRALNRVQHHGLLDGWWFVSIDKKSGKKSTRYFRPKYDL